MFKHLDIPFWDFSILNQLTITALMLIF